MTTQVDVTPMPALFLSKEALHIPPDPVLMRDFLRLLYEQTGTPRATPSAAAAIALIGLGEPNGGAQQYVASVPRLSLAAKRERRALRLQKTMDFDGTTQDQPSDQTHTAVTEDVENKPVVRYSIFKLWPRKDYLLDANEKYAAENPGNAWEAPKPKGP